jgi:hypothetical protein
LGFTTNVGHARLQRLIGVFYHLPASLAAGEMDMTMVLFSRDLTAHI